MNYDLSVTTSALLEGLHATGNDAAWQALDDRYRPILIATGRRFGLSNSDAVDIAQETMLRVLEGCRAAQYDRSKGRLRTWILTIARHRMVDLHRRRLVRKEAAGVSAIQESPDDAALEACWLTEERNAVLREAMATLHDSNLATETVEAFELHCINGLPPQAVADRLGLTVNDVYLAKSRVTKRLRAVIEETTARWNEDA